MAKSKWQTQYSLLDRVSDPSDKKAWEDFVTFYKQYIYNILRGCGTPQDYTDDLSQNILLKLWKSLPDFTLDRDRGKFRKWLNTIIRNEARKYYRDNKKRTELRDEHNCYISDQLHNDSEDENLNAIIENEWKNHITRTAWERLKMHSNKTMQKIFLMSMEGKSNEEIAKNIDINKNSVAVYKQRIKKALKEEIEKIDIEFI